MLKNMNTHYIGLKQGRHLLMSEWFIYIVLFNLVAFDAFSIPSLQENIVCLVVSPLHTTIWMGGAIWNGTELKQYWNMKCEIHRAKKTKLKHKEFNL